MCELGRRDINSIKGEQFICFYYTEFKQRVHIQCVCKKC